MACLYGLSALFVCIVWLHLLIAILLFRLTILNEEPVIPSLIQKGESGMTALLVETDPFFLFGPTQFSIAD